MTRSIVVGFLVVATVALAGFALIQARNLQTEAQLRSSEVTARMAAEKDLQSARAQIAELKGEKEATDTALKASREKVSQLQASDTALKAAQEQLAQLRTADAALKERIAQLEKEKGEAETALNGAQEQIHGLQAAKRVAETAKEVAEKALEDARKGDR